MSPAQVLATSVGKTLADRTLLRSVDVAVEGGLVMVLGPNGAGKSTLLRLLATVMHPDHGDLLIDGLDPRHETDRVEIRRRVGYLPQEPEFHPSARVFDLLDYLAVLKGIDHDRNRKRWIFWALDQVGLRDRAQDRIGDLSGGMRRRVGIAQALLGQPTLLVFDEPGAGLDPDERIRLRELLAARRTNATIVVSTHMTDEAAFGDRIIVLSAGEVAFVGTPDQLREVAAGKCWVEQHRPAGAAAAWQQPDGTHRCVGQPPPGAHLVEPTLEDGYLLVRT